MFPGAGVMRGTAAHNCRAGVGRYIRGAMSCCLTLLRVRPGQVDDHLQTREGSEAGFAGDDDDDNNNDRDEAEAESGFKGCLVASSTAFAVCLQAALQVLLILVPADVEYAV